MELDKRHDKPITNAPTFDPTSLQTYSHSTFFTNSRSRCGAMFPGNHREPSSPKVTCIGQVRGKSRKHGDKMKMLACRSHPPRNQRWVHLPFKDFSCLIPCKSSCFSSTTSTNHGINDDIITNDNDKGGSSSCGGVFRWMLSVHDGEGGGQGRRDVEFVVNGDDQEFMDRTCSRRRSIFDDMEFDDLFGNNYNDNDRAKISICVPPPNALLLMRCRSDPMRMASLQEHLIPNVVSIKQEDHLMFERFEEMVEIKEDEDEEIDEIIELNVQDLEEKNDEPEDINNRGKAEEKQTNLKHEGDLEIGDETQLVQGLDLVDGCSIQEEFEECGNGQDLCKKKEDDETVVETEETCVLSTDSSTLTTSLQDSTAESTESETKVIVEGEARKSTDKENNKPMLPDCLLLMMCEPKLSMEVSTETWVCGTDFIRCLPERNHGSKKPNKIEAADDHTTTNNTTNKKTKASAVAALPPLPPSTQAARSAIQPGRSSISFPASGGSVANLIEQKLAKAGVGFEPFVLTRCKSAPLRSTAKFEPHRQATCGVGAAGVGF